MLLGEDGNVYKSHLGIVSSVEELSAYYICV